MKKLIIILSLMLLLGCGDSIKDLELSHLTIPGLNTYFLYLTTSFYSKYDQDEIVISWKRSIGFTFLLNA